MKTRKRIQIGILFTTAALLCLLYFSRKSAEPSVITKPISRSTASLGVENKCIFFYTNRNQNRQFLSKQGLRFYRNVKENRVLAHEFIPPKNPNGTVVVLLHGLGDDLFSLQAFAKKALADGFGILRVDLHGHGESLIQHLKLNNNELPDVFDYKHNIEDIQGLIGKLRLDNVAIVGHSYGGGIALKLGEVMPKEKVKYVMALAPYVQRIDKYLTEAVTSGQYAIDSFERFFDTISLSKDFSRPIVQQMFSYAQDVANKMKLMLSLSSFFLGTERFKDLVLDPKMDRFMYDNYKKYFLHQMGKTESDLTQSENEFLDLKIYAAIKVTKGVRGLDYLSPVTGIGKMPALVQVVGGNQDKLVAMEQLESFKERAKRFDVSIELIELYGPMSTHLFPQNIPDRVYEIFLEAMTRPGL